MHQVEFMRVSTDVLIIGSGAAGMYAAVAAARNGADVLLADKSLIGRGGATIMAQMTVAAAVGQQEPDHWSHHLADTLAAGHGLCDEALSALLCEQAPARIMEMDDWKVGWARSKDTGRMVQVMAPGHQVARCVYVDFLNTGPAVARTLRGEVAQRAGIRRVSGLSIIELLVNDNRNRVMGALAIDVESATPVVIAASAIIIAAGGLTRLYQRNSASLNMGGESYALALRAGAELIDMEFVQFFPIGHLAPRLVGMDPIMWDPFRYKLGGRLLNGHFEEFMHHYGGSDEGHYTARRDLASYAIYKEVEAGRGSPHGGAWLSFQHLPAATLQDAFGPVIERLAKNNIDLTQSAVEVSPIAHYHMGGIRVDEHMQTRVEGLFAAGEAVGGANGANRLSGNAISEALVFGERAGHFAALAVRKNTHRHRIPQHAIKAKLEPLYELTKNSSHSNNNATALFRELQTLMNEKVGLLRDQEKLDSALTRIKQLQSNDLMQINIPADKHYNQPLLDWLDLRAGLLCAEAVTVAASNRKESRGAHQREDMPTTSPTGEVNQILSLQQGELISSWTDVPRVSYTLATKQLTDA